MYDQNKKKFEFISQLDFNYLNEIKMLWKLRNGIVNLGCFIKAIYIQIRPSNVKHIIIAWKVYIKRHLRQCSDTSGEPLENLWTSVWRRIRYLLYNHFTYISIASKSLNSNDPLAVLIPCNNKKTQRMVPVLGINSWRFLGSSLTFNFYLCDSLYQMFI